MPSQKKKISPKSRKSSSAWNLFFGILFYVVLLVLVVYLTLALYMTWQYYSLKTKLQHFSLSNLELMSQDLDAKYDFQKDELAVQDANSKLAKDLTDAMLHYYDNNLQTVKTVVNNMIREQVDIAASYASTVANGQDLEAFKAHAEAFVKKVSEHVKAPILQQCNYFVRFFSLLVSVLPLAATESILGELKDFLQHLLTSHGV